MAITSNATRKDRSDRHCACNAIEQSSNGLKLCGRACLDAAFGDCIVQNPRSRRKANRDLLSRIGAIKHVHYRNANREGQRDAMRVTACRTFIYLDCHVSHKIKPYFVVLRSLDRTVRKVPKDLRQAPGAHDDLAANECEPPKRDESPLIRNEL
jgi:hypothetical protein